jgi:hypothetical protein
MKFSIVSIAACGALAGALSGCGSDAPTTPDARVSPSLVLNSVTVSPQTAILGPGGTQQLSVSAAALDSSAITAYDTVFYTSTDTTHAKVSATGLITAVTGSKAPTGSTPVRIIASLVKDHVTRIDTCSVTVVPTTGSNPIFTIADLTAATVKLVSGTPKAVAAKLTYTTPTGTATITGAAVPIKMRITPTTSASVTSTTSFTPFTSQGTVFITATTTAFGVTLTDTITYLLGDPTSLTITFQNTGLIFYQAATAAPANAYNTSTTLYLRAGGSILFSNNMLNAPYVLNVGFTASNGGVAPDSALNLNGTLPTNRKTVAFPVAGTYVYTWGGDAANLTTADKRSSTIIVRP